MQRSIAPSTNAPKMVTFHDVKGAHFIVIIANILLFVIRNWFDNSRITNPTIKKNYFYLLTNVVNE